jgi:hypothetical protein
LIPDGAVVESFGAEHVRRWLIQLMVDLRLAVDVLRSLAEVDGILMVSVPNSGSDRYLLSGELSDSHRKPAHPPKPPGGVARHGRSSLRQTDGKITLLQLRVSDRAARQIREASHWWDENRSSAPDALRDEIERAFLLDINNRGSFGV